MNSSSSGASGDGAADRELLELAAKAAGIDIRPGRSFQAGMFFVDVPNPDGKVTGREWNPLTNDGDALRLAVKLNIDLVNATASEDGSEGQSVVFALRGDFDSLTEWHDTAAEKMPATRRAIVRAAAEIGKQANRSHGSEQDEDASR